MRSALARHAASVSPLAADRLLAGALAIAAALEVGGSTVFPGSRAAAAAAIPVMTLPLAWRRSAPVAAFLAVYAAYAVQALAGGHAEQSIALSLALLVAVYSVAAHADDGRVAVAAIMPAQGIAWLALAAEGGRGVGDYVFSVLLGGGAWLGGYAVRSGRLVAAQHERRAEQAIARSTAEREQASAAERARIAREMHDVVAHAMSVIVVQTGAARQLVRDEPERSEEMLELAESTGREALSEMRRLVGLVRTNADGLGLAPQPGLAQLDEVAARARDAGFELSIEREGEQPRLPPGLDLAAYRIAQEAVTNAIKYGSGPATLRLRNRDEQLEIELRNAIAARPRRVGGGGHGLLGMHERVALYGGTLEAGEVAAGEFRMHARLPLAQHTA